MLADRLPRKLLLEGAALLAAVSQMVAAAGMLGGFASIPLLATLGAVNGAATAVTMPAASAITPQTVPTDLLRQANALVRTGMYSAMIIGASAGGLLVATVGSGWALAIDAATFVATAGCFAAVRVPSTSGMPRSQPLAELRQGWREFTGRSWVIAIGLQFLVLNAVLSGAIQVLGPVIADDTIGRTSWGLVTAAQMLGSVLGGVLAAHWQPKRALRYGTALAAVTAVPIFVLAHQPHLVALSAGMLAGGLATEQFGVAWDVSLQENIPQEVLARVYSFEAVCSYAAIPLGQIVAGPLAAAIGITATLDGAAGLIILATIGALAVPGVRHLSTRTGAEPSPRPIDQVSAKQ
ncbi:MFS transporter [Nonomuraea turcica]|uniref:MFS transporter n=1 Tax=Nonomuraea sp. G32 TaxID=3067274 RepID=UPI003530273C